MTEVFELGDHRVSNGDITEGAIEELMGADMADVIWSDPPWGVGNLKYWQTMNAKMTGAEKREVENKSFLQTFFQIATRYSKGPVIVEYGVRWAEEVINAGKESGLIHHMTAEVRYRSGSRILPCHSHLFCKPGVPVPHSWEAYLTGTMGLTAVIGAVGSFAVSDGILLDPCCGLGLAAKAALAFNMKFRGNELNRKRLGVTIGVIKKHGGK